MAWKHHRIWIVAVLAASGVALAWMLANAPDRPSAGMSVPVSSTTPDLSGRAIYTNGEHGFSIVYPETAKLEESFSTEYHLGTEWRANAIGTGTPIIALVAYSTVSDHSYPRNFAAQVRVGASSDPKEIAACLTAAPGAGETPLPDAAIGGIAWKAFAFASAGMMQYAEGVSYRTLHEGKCFALEKAKTGSSYRDDPDSPDDIADAVLEARYESLNPIVESFTFARP